MATAMSKTLTPRDESPSPAETPAAVSDAASESVAQAETAPPAKPAPNAIVTRAAFEAARTSGTWMHDDPSTALWLNSTFPAKNVDADTLTATLALHGVVVQ